MNIMLASVLERIKEIGLRLSLGAKKVDIINQFLFEAINDQCDRWFNRCVLRCFYRITSQQICRYPHSHHIWFYFPFIRCSSRRRSYFWNSPPHAKQLPKTPFNHFAMNKILSVVTILVLLSTASLAQSRLSLFEVIEQAKNQSPAAKAAETRKKNFYWQYRNFRANYNPQSKSEW